MVKVYVLGSNGNHQLGLPHSDDLIIPELSLLLPNDTTTRVEKISCGGNHTAILINDGTVYITGENTKGQLVDNDKIQIVKGWRKLNQDGIKDITCGWEFTSIIDKENNVYICGHGPKGELGLGKDVLQSNTFQKVMSIDPENTVELFSSFQNCVVLVKKHNGGSKIFGWGSNTKCQLFEPKCKSVSEPTVIFDNDTEVIDYVAMGKNFMVLVNDKGTIISIKGAIPEGFKLEDWSHKNNLHIYTMWSSLHIEVQGKIYSFGFGAFGQIFDNEYFNSNIIKERDTKFVSLNVGSEHGIVVVEESGIKDYEIFCWGWGEHGNCGRIYDERDNGNTNNNIINDLSNVTSKINKIMTVRKSRDLRCAPIVFGGCASTWVVVYE